MVLEPVPEDPAESEDKRTLLREMYSELRSYRHKEFQTFIFTFPIVGIGFLLIVQLNVPRDLLVLPRLLLCVFGAVAIFYIRMNHNRMNKIKGL